MTENPKKTIRGKNITKKEKSPKKEKNIGNLVQ